MQEYYDVYRKGKRSGSLMRVGRKLTKEEANACMKKQRQLDKDIGDTNYTYHKSPAEP